MSLASYGRTDAQRSRTGTATAFTEVLRRPYVLLAALLIAGTGVLYLLTLRPGITWDGDYALYIMHAMNIVHGLPYAETGYLYNPDNPSWPASYPPGLPLLLAPVYAVFGLDLEAMKIALILCFLGFLAVYAAIARRALPRVAALCTVAALALSPFLLDFKNIIFSEFPFLLTSYLALHLVDRLDGSPPVPAHTPLIVVAGLALGFAYEIRTVGVVLLCAVAVVAVLRLRSTGAAAAGVLILGCLTAWGVGSLFPADIGTYLRFFDGYSLATPFEDLGNYVHAFISVLDLGRLPQALAWLIGGTIAVLIVTGVIGRMRTRITVFEIFSAGYAAFLLIYPIKEEPARYALPLLPMVFLYAFCGAHRLGRRVGRVPDWAAAVAALGLFATAYLPALASLSRAELPGSPTGAALTAFFRDARKILPEDAVLTTADPTVVALFTGRRARLWSRDHDNTLFWEELDATGSAYLIENEVYGSHGDSFPFTRRNRKNMEVVLRNSGLTLYRVR